jgi:hypothetical protein
LTDTGGTPWGTAAAGVVAGVSVLAGVAAGEVPLLGASALVPLGVILVLAGVAAARHRDWILFDRQAGEIAFRRGLASMFRPVRAIPFGEVEAIRVEADGAGQAVSLCLAGDAAWPLAAGLAPVEAERLVAAVRRVGRWPVLETPEAAPR